MLLDSLQKKYGKTYLLKRLHARVKKLKNECWQWKGSFNSKGYSQISLTHTQKVLGHVLSYFLYIGEVPDGLELDHLCRHTWCVNPYHLEPVTHLINVQRGNAGKHLRDKTHCVNGHAYTKENTKLVKNGRDCKKCCVIRQLRWRKKKSVNIT